MQALANVVTNALYISNNSSSELAPTAILSTYNAIQKQVAFKSRQLREVAYSLPVYNNDWLVRPLWRDMM